ncbi:MAG: FHA domain-containing protein [Blautia sp.]|nr:FHA domain-containing protein [Blautia sp.]
MARNDYHRRNVGPVDDGFTMPPADIPTEVEESPMPPYRRAYDEDDLKTIPMSAMPATPSGAEADEVTSVFENEQTKMRMTMGWLVGIKGECRGMDFRLHSGENLIGRGENMDIRLNDSRIDRAPVMSIFYDPRSNFFFANKGTGTSCLAYINNRMVMGEREIKPFDRIQLAWEKNGVAEDVCELLFVPLCGENFKWTDTENTEKS